MELLTTPCFTFLRIFLLSTSSFTPAIVLSVSFASAIFNFQFPSFEDTSIFNFESGSFPRNPIISVSCVQNFFSSSGESVIQDNFWRRLSSWVNWVIGKKKIKWLEYTKVAKNFNTKKCSNIWQVEKSEYNLY